MQKLLIGFLAVTAVVLGIVCTSQARRLRAIQANEYARGTAETAATASQNAQMDRIKELERANERLEQQVQKFATVTTQLRTNEARQASNLALLSERMRSTRKGGAPGADAERGNLGKGMGEMLGTMMKDPAMREMMREQQKVAVNMMYSGLFKDLKLSAEEKEKMKEILSDAQMKGIEHAQGMFGDNQPGSGEETKKLLEEGKKQTEADLKALLGEERYAYYQDYQKTVGERMQLDQLKAQLAGQNLALQDQQSGQLLQIMQEEKTAVPPIIPTDGNQFPNKELFTAENLDKQLKWMEDYNRRVLDRAGQVLTPEQLAQYQAFQKQQASLQEMGLKMARQMFGGDKPATPPPAP